MSKVISRFRTILAWLLLLALPLQGFAAASMLYCGPAGGKGPAMVAEHAHTMTDAHGMEAAHEHQSREPASHAGHHETDKLLPDAGHSCGVCAACSHSIAIAQTSQVVNLSPVPRAIRCDSIVSFSTRPSPVPDKPPRA